VRFTVLDYQPTCGQLLQIESDDGQEMRVLCCTLAQEHRGPDHEDDDGNRWHSTFSRTAPFPEGEVVESVVFRWGGRTRLPL
jgi:hypothetical protein